MITLISQVKPPFGARRVPPLRQLNDVECGATCLAMILSYFGRRTEVTECRERCGSGRDGVTARMIAEAARSFGLRVHAYSLEPLDFRQLPLPAIIHWEFNHFVVLERWSPAGAWIVDPAVGRRKLTAAEFDASFTGVALALEPGENFQRRRPAGRPGWGRYLAAMWRLPGAAGLLRQVLAASALLQGFGLALPLFTLLVVDRILPAGVSNLMTLLGLGILLMVLAQALTGYLRAALLLYLQVRVDSHLMLDFFEHVLSLPLRFFHERSSGDLLNRLGSNTMIRETLTGQMLSVILDGGLVLAYLVVLWIKEPSYGLLVLLLGGLQAGLLAATATAAHGLMQADLVAQSESQSYLLEAVKGIASVKAAASEEQVLERWSDLFVRHLNANFRRSRLTAQVDAAVTAIRSLAPLALLWYGASLVLGGQISLGAMLALNALAGATLAPLASLVSNGQRLQLVAAHLARITDVLDAEPEQDRQSVRAAPQLQGRIELRNVGFRYQAGSGWALRNVSIRIEPGQKVAIVGRTGSGKTTLAMILLGLYTPTVGQVLYDGLPLQDLDFRTLRGQFGAVLQEPALFSGSIRQNIVLNNPRAPMARVMEAARLAGIHDDIMGMPMGYETRIGEDGAGLSGGQRQRLALARALAGQPAILLLDEATSHLDAVTEQRVNANLGPVGCTHIVIAHRLSTVRDADLILVLDGGTVVEQGRHEELLARKGLYADLVGNQLEQGAYTLDLGAGGRPYDAETYRTGTAGWTR